MLTCTLQKEHAALMNVCQDITSSSLITCNQGLQNSVTLATSLAWAILVCFHSKISLLIMIIFSSVRCPKSFIDVIYFAFHNRNLIFLKAFYFEMISILQKSCNYFTKNSHVSFRQMMQLLKISYIHVIFLCSLYMCSAYMYMYAHAHSSF